MTIGNGRLGEVGGSRYAKTLDIRIIPLSDSWALRNVKICVRSTICPARPAAGKP
jgi:hypothetical protein